VDAEHGYPDERWLNEERNYPEPDWRERRGGYPPEDDQGRAPTQRGGYPPAEVNAGYGGDQRFAPAAGGYGDPGYPGRPQPDPAYDPRGAMPPNGDPRGGPPMGAPMGGPGAAPMGGPQMGGPPMGGPPMGGAPGFGPRPPERAAAPLDPQTSEVPRTRAERAAEEGVYRSKKPLHAVAIGVLLGIFELIMLGVFFGSADAHRTIAGGLMLIALPMFGIGFYALLTGAGHAGPRAFLRTPLAYLVIGLILMLAAGSAA
jgi:hypothetical protein